MSSGFPTFKITGCPHPHLLSDAFMTHLMDIAILAHVEENFALAVAQDHDSIDWSNEEDCNSIINLIGEKLNLAGINDIEISILVLDA